MAPFPSPTTTPQPTYYEILGLSPSLLDSENHPAQTLKRAYHRALLSHHPDKRKQKQPAPTSFQIPSSSSYLSSPITIDQISLAYTTLSSPSQRLAYDNFLLTQSTTTTTHNPSFSGTFQTGIEITDLDDLSFDSVKEEWYRSCRCGNPRGYRFGEHDLEEAAEYVGEDGGAEVMVGCADCSLWLRVRFAVVDDDQQEDGQDGQEEEEEPGKEGGKQQGSP